MCSSDLSIDQGTHSINLYDITSSGGNISLTGQILSTGAGRVLAFNGQPSLTISNNSSWSLSTGAIDLSPISGTITIVDTPRMAMVPSEVDIDNNAIRFVNPHNLTTGTQIYYEFNSSIDASGAVVTTSPIDGLTNQTVYFAQVIDPTTISLRESATSSSNVNLTSWDSGRSSSFTLATVHRNLYQLDDSGGGLIREESLLIGSSTDYTDPIRTTIGATTSADRGGLVRATTYTPQAGLTYSWTEGQSATETRVLYAAEKTFNFFYNFPAGSDEWDSVNVVVTDQTPLLEGEALLPVAPDSFSTAGKAYEVLYKQEKTGEAAVTVRNWTTGGGFLRKKTYHTQRTEIQGIKNYYTHSLRADHPIEIGFITPDPQSATAAGALTISSSGDVTLTQGVDQASQINITTTNERSISLRSLLVQDASVPLTLRAAGNIDLQVGGSSSSTDAINLQASAGGNLRVESISNAGAVAPLRLRPDGTGLALEAGQTLALLLAGGLDSSLQPSGDAPLLQAQRLEMRVGAGDVGAAEAPLRINSSRQGVNTVTGLALNLTAADASASLLETDGDLQLILPQSFSATSAISAAAEVRITVRNGDLLNGTGEAINPVDVDVLAALDDSFKITGDAAVDAGRAELQSQDSSNYFTYWTSYRGWTQADDGSWQAPASPLHTEASFSFTNDEIGDLRASGFSDSAIDTYQSEIGRAHV